MGLDAPTGRRRYPHVPDDFATVRGSRVEVTIGLGLDTHHVPPSLFEKDGFYGWRDV